MPPLRLASRGVRASHDLGTTSGLPIAEPSRMVQEAPRLWSAPTTRLAVRDGCTVVLVEPERMNLLGLILSSLLTRRLAEPAARRHASSLRGYVRIEASKMGITLGFEPGVIEISRRAPPHPRAQIQGTLRALLGAALGRDRVRSVLTGKLKARGNPMVLWHVLALMRA